MDTSAMKLYAYLWASKRQARSQDQDLQMGDAITPKTYASL